MRTALLALLLLACSEQDYGLTTHPYEGDDGGIEGAGGIAGRICLPGGDGVVGAQVWVEHAQGRAEATTDALGDFELGPVPPGPQVVHALKGSFSATFEVEVVADQVVELPSECLDGLDIAVVSGEYDSIELVLDDLGFSYTLLNGTGWDQVELLTEPDVIGAYDIVFLNCGMNPNWTGIEEEAVATVRAYVDGGGSLYASDWSYWLVERSFPDFLDFAGDDLVEDAAQAGAVGSLTAQVHDPVMVAALGGSTADISFDLPDWVAVQAAADPAWVLVDGTFPLSGGGQLHGPLAARMPYGDGAVLFTSFHNEAQATDDVQVLMREIVLGL